MVWAAAGPLRANSDRRQRFTPGPLVDICFGPWIAISKKRSALLRAVLSKQAGPQCSVPSAPFTTALGISLHYCVYAFWVLCNILCHFFVNNKFA